MLSPQDARIQEILALTVVGLVAFGWVFKVGRTMVAPLVAQWLLNRGQVKWAMRLKAWSTRRRSPIPPKRDCHD